jgi:hypothetical protein
MVLDADGGAEARRLHEIHCWGCSEYDGHRVLPEQLDGDDPGSAQESGPFHLPPPVCGAQYTTDGNGFASCSRELSHDGKHRSRSGITWGSEDGGIHRSPIGPMSPAALAAEAAGRLSSQAMVTADSWAHGIPGQCPPGCPECRQIIDLQRSVTAQKTELRELHHAMAILLKRMGGIAQIYPRELAAIPSLTRIVTYKDMDGSLHLSVIE